MERKMLKSKLHRATVTHADLEYEGSVTIDENLMDAADIWENESVHIWNVTNGSRFETYALKGERGKGEICINGAAAHLTKPGDKVIIATFAQMAEAEARKHEPKLVFLGRENTIKELGRPEVPGPKLVGEVS